MKSKLKELTSRSNGWGYAKRKQKLKEYIRWWVGYSPIMHLAASSKKLHQAGYPTLMGSYLEWHPK